MVGVSIGIRREVKEGILIRLWDLLVGVTKYTMLNKILYNYISIFSITIWIAVISMNGLTFKFQHRGMVPADAFSLTWTVSWLLGPSWVPS